MLLQRVQHPGELIFLPQRTTNIHQIKNLLIALRPDQWFGCYRATNSINLQKYKLLNTTVIQPAACPVHDVSSELLVSNDLWKSLLEYRKWCFHIFTCLWGEQLRQVLIRGHIMLQKKSLYLLQCLINLIEKNCSIQPQQRPLSSQTCL